MSVITNMIFIISSTDKNVMFDINKWLESEDYGRLNRVSKHAGGYKFFEAQVFMAAFNHFFINGFINFIKKLSWNEPERVQAFIKREFDDKFKIIEIFRG